MSLNGFTQCVSEICMNHTHECGTYSKPPLKPNKWNNWYGRFLNYVKNDSLILCSLKSE